MALSNDELACVYAALILADDNVDIKGDKITSILKAANYEIEPYWPGLFASALEGVKVTDLIKNVGSAPVAAGASIPAGKAAAAEEKKPAGGKEAAKKEEKKAEKDDSDEGEDMVCIDRYFFSKPIEIICFLFHCRVSVYSIKYNPLLTHITSLLSTVLFLVPSMFVCLLFMK
jgi:large subunit ribosomal protein LP1